MKLWACRSKTASFVGLLFFLSSGLATAAPSVPFFRQTIAAIPSTMFKDVTPPLPEAGRSSSSSAASTPATAEPSSASFKAVFGVEGTSGAAQMVQSPVPASEESLPKPRLTHPPPRLVREGPGWRMEFISQCELPTDKGTFMLRGYRYTKGDKVVEPVALFQGELQGGEDVLLRVHDQCMTSEVLGSRRCDCREQLHLAIDKLCGERGLIIYLPQEGRGIGLANKIAAYALQDRGLDTVEANEQLGFGEDERSYEYVPFILEDFGIESVRLMTNNPFKVRSLQALDVVVSNVVPHQSEPNPHNLKYLQTKISKMEHKMVLPGMETGEDEDDEEGFKERTEEEGSGGSLADSLTDSDRQSTSSSDAEATLSDSEDVPGAVEASCATEEGYAFGRETVVAALEAIREGKMVLVVDDKDRENEGDLIMAAEKATTESIAFIVRYSSGVICVAMEGDDLDRLQLPPMVVNNEDPKQTAFTVTVDYKHGTTTGISAADRALTLRKLADPSAAPSDFNRPGHIFPLRYRKGGVLTRRGHTEAAVDLSRLAGLKPAGVLCEVCNDDGSMARLPQLMKFARKHKMVLTSIQDLAAYRREEEAASA